jgi:hypothetical protein
MRRTQSIRVLLYSVPTGTRPGSAAIVEAHSAKGAAHAFCNRNVKALRVVTMVARQDAKRLDLVSYTLVFLVVAVVGEAILAALIW